MLHWKRKSAINASTDRISQIQDTFNAETFPYVILQNNQMNVKIFIEKLRCFKSLVKISPQITITGKEKEQ